MAQPQPSRVSDEHDITTLDTAELVWHLADSAAKGKNPPSLPPFPDFETQPVLSETEHEWLC